MSKGYEFDFEHEDRQYDVWQKLNSAPTEDLLDAITETDELPRDTAAGILIARGDQTIVRRAIELCKNDQADIRRAAARIVGELLTPDPQSKSLRDSGVAALEDLLKSDQSSVVRSTAAEGLGHMKSVSSLDLLLANSADGEPCVRAAIAWALGRLGAPNAEPAIRHLLEDKEDEVADRAAMSLETIAWEKLGNESTSSLLARLCDADRFIRKAAAIELGFRSDAIQPAFSRGIELRSSKRVEFREIAAILFGEICAGQKKKDEISEKIVEELCELLSSDPSPTVRAAAADGLGNAVAVSAVGDLIRTAGDPSPSVRAAVAWALGRLALPKAIPTLNNLRNDQHEDVAGWAGWSLRTIGRRKRSKRKDQKGVRY